MNSPGAKDNPTGPFEVVDLDGYAVKPGYSGDTTTRGRSFESWFPMKTALYAPTTSCRAAI